MPNTQSFVFPGEILPFDGSAVLYPDFIASPHADDVFSSLLASTGWEKQSLVMFGKIVEEPRLSTWHSEPHLTYTYSGAKRTPVAWTPQLVELRGLCESQVQHTFNGVLINLYRNGKDHLSWHSDDETVNGSEPVIASLSFGAERKFELRHKETGVRVSTMLPHGSLLVMSGLSQARWVHRVPKSSVISEPRINLTFRHLLI